MARALHCIRSWHIQLREHTLWALCYCWPSWPDANVAAQTAAPPPAFVYSDGYRTRAKIHKIGSLAMVPLLTTQGLIGRSIFNEPTPGKREWHGRVAWGIGGLFAANTVTGAWNLIEGRKN